jgi:cell division initiation protein
MKVAPIDIAHKSFNRKMMGLDPEDVTTFLRQIAEEMESLIRDRNNLREQIREKDLAIIEFRERDELLKNTITTATKMSERLQSDAEREARLIISDAKQQGEMIIRDARDSLKKIFGEITELKKIRMQYENNLRTLISSHLQMMDQGHKIMPDPEIVASTPISTPGIVPAATAQTAPNQTANSNLFNRNELDAIKQNVTDAVARSIRNIDL